MKPVKIKADDPYTEIAKIIEEWCKHNIYDSFVVTISRNGEIITEYLELDGSSIDFIWEMDWWEGKKEIYLLGFMPMCQLRVYGAGETHYDKLRAMSVEEMAEWLCDVAGWLPTFEGRVHPILEWLKEEATE